MIIAKMTLLLGFAGCVSATQADFNSGDQIIKKSENGLHLLDEQENYWNHLFQIPAGTPGEIVDLSPPPDVGKWTVKFDGNTYLAHDEDLFFVHDSMAADPEDSYSRRLATNPLIERLVREG